MFNSVGYWCALPFMHGLLCDVTWFTCLNWCLRRVFILWCWVLLLIVDLIVALHVLLVDFACVDCCLRLAFL